MSSGALITAGSVDFQEANPSVAPTGTTRMFRQGGLLKVSTDGGPFTAVGGATVLSRAQSLLPTSGLTRVMGPGDFDGSHVFGEAAGTAGTGTLAMSATDKGGVVKVASGATANSLIQACTPGTNVAGRGITSLIDNARTTPWYFYVLLKALTGVDAAGVARAQLAAMSGGAPANPTFGVGLSGDVSITNFVYRLTNGGGSVVASGSGPVLDTTTQHTAEITNDGTVSKVLFDGVQIGTDIASSLIGTVPMTWVVSALNGATAANREIDVDTLWVIV